MVAKFLALIFGIFLFVTAMFFAYLPYGLGGPPTDLGFLSLPAAFSNLIRVGVPINTFYFWAWLLVLLLSGALIDFGLSKRR